MAFFYQIVIDGILAVVKSKKGIMAASGKDRLGSPAMLVIV